MPEPRSRVDPDPWRVVADLVDAVPADRRAHPELAARLDAVRAHFGNGGASATSDLLDEVDRRAVVDVDAPVDSSRPIVPRLKLAVRKANAFVSRHLAQQVTVLVEGLSLAVRQLDERVRRLEQGSDGGAAAAFVPDRSADFADALGPLAGDAPRRTVRSWAEVRTLPPADAGLVTVVALGDVLTVGGRLVLLEQVRPALRLGGWLAIVGIQPDAWLDVAGPVASDLAPGRPIHAGTWAHLLEQQGAAEITTSETDHTYLVAGRW